MLRAWCNMDLDKARAMKIQSWKENSETKCRDREITRPVQDWNFNTRYFILDHSINDLYYTIEKLEDGFVGPVFFFFWTSVFKRQTSTTSLFSVFCWALPMALIQWCSIQWWIRQRNYHPYLLLQRLPNVFYTRTDSNI